MNAPDQAVNELRNALLRRVHQQQAALAALQPWGDSLAARLVQQRHEQIRKRLYEPGFETDAIVELRFNEAAHLLDKLRAIPLVLRGQRFKHSRGKGDFGPLRKEIVKVLTKHGNDLKPRDVWAVLKAKPPRGWKVYEWKGLANLLIDCPGSSIDRKNFTNRVGRAKAARRK